MAEEVKGHLVVTVAEASGKNKEDATVWDASFIEGFVKVEVRGGPRNVKVQSTPKRVLANSIKWDEELTLEVLEGSTELRLMLCREKRSGARVGTSVIAACGIFVKDILDAVPIDKYFELFKPGQGGEGGFIRISMNFVKDLRTGEERTNTNGSAVRTFEPQLSFNNYRADSGVLGPGTAYAPSTATIPEKAAEKLPEKLPEKGPAAAAAVAAAGKPATEKPPPGPAPLRDAVKEPAKAPAKPPAAPVPSQGVHEDHKKKATVAPAPPPATASGGRSVASQKGVVSEKLAQPPAAPPLPAPPTEQKQRPPIVKGLLAVLLIGAVGAAGKVAYDTFEDRKRTPKGIVPQEEALQEKRNWIFAPKDK